MLKALTQRRRGRLEASMEAGAWSGPIFRDMSAGEDLEEAQPAGKRTALGRAIYNDIRWYLPSLLQVEDRMSMAFSLESRAPLLDYRIVEHAAIVPSTLKMKNMETKHILRRAVRDLLPAAVYNRKDKMGMPTPIALWFRGSLAGWVRSELSRSTIADSGLFDAGYVQACIDEHLAGQRDRSVEIWKLLNVAAWWRIYVEDSNGGIEQAKAGLTVGAPA
jgi:asparagine synthase (glutamine-hydrolysing)